MRISDWSSDVCSSDLRPGIAPHGTGQAHPRAIAARQARKLAGRTGRELGDRADALGPLSVVAARSWACRRGMAAPQERRSEEHTSELQSLMRISYAVFCLQKRKGKQAQKPNVTPSHNTANGHTKTNNRYC